MTCARLTETAANFSLSQRNQSCAVALSVSAARAAWTSFLESQSAGAAAVAHDGGAGGLQGGTTCVQTI